jgi:hypothetical protein
MAAGELIGLGWVAPPMGPFPFGWHIWDEGRVCFVEAVIGSRKVGDQHSLCHGEKYQEQLFKFLSSFVSGWKGIVCDDIQDVQDMKDSLSQTYRYWFKRFMLGCHKQMGDMVAVSDYALSVEIFQDIFGERIFGINVKCGRTQYH